MYLEEAEKLGCSCKQAETGWSLQASYLGTKPQPTGNFRSCPEETMESYTLGSVR